jgi:hypothetical protein
MRHLLLRYVGSTSNFQVQIWHSKYIRTCLAVWHHNCRILVMRRGDPGDFDSTPRACLQSFLMAKQFRGWPSVSVLHSCRGVGSIGLELWPRPPRRSTKEVTGFRQSSRSCRPLEEFPCFWKTKEMGVEFGVSCNVP